MEPSIIAIIVSAFFTALIARRDLTRSIRGFISETNFLLATSSLKKSLNAYRKYIEEKSSRDKNEQNTPINETVTKIFDTSHIKPYNTENIDKLYKNFLIVSDKFHKAEDKSKTEPSELKDMKEAINQIREMNKKIEKTKKDQASPLQKTASAITKNSATKEEKKKNTIIEILIEKKTKRDDKSVLISITALAIYTPTVLLTPIDMSPTAFIALCLYIGIVNLNQRILNYRIKNGFYGGNPYEAREIIRFIEENYDPDDFHDNGERRKLLPDAEKKSPKRILQNGLKTPKGA